MRERTFAASRKGELGALRKQSKIEFAARVEGGELVLDVAGEGAPIPAESLSKIVEPFHRADPAADGGRLSRSMDGSTPPGCG